LAQPERRVVRAANGLWTALATRSRTTRSSVFALPEVTLPTRRSTAIRNT